MATVQTLSCDKCGRIDAPGNRVRTWECGKDHMDLCDRCVRKIRGDKSPVRTSRVIGSVDEIPLDG